MAEEQRNAALPSEPQPPPGYRRVAEDERLRTLETLQVRRREVEVEARALPLRIETMGQRRRERELNKRREQLEKLLSMFGQPVVFIPADAEPIPVA